MNKLRKITEYLFYLYIFILPWQTKWVFDKAMIKGQIVDYWSFSLFATDILLIVVLIMLLMFSEYKKLKKLPITLLVLIIAFLATLFLSIHWALDKQITFYYLVQGIKGIIILLLILKFRFDKLKIYGSLLLAGTVQAILAIVEFIWQKIPQATWLGLNARSPEDLGVNVVEIPQRILRAYGTFDSPNVLAGFLAICIFVGILFYLAQNKKICKIITCVCISICTIGLFLTFSRAAWLALAIGLLASLVCYFIKAKDKDRFKVLKICVLIIFIFGVFAASMPDLINTRLQGQTRLEVKSLEERSTQYSQASEIFKDNWQFGVGLGNYTKALSQEIDPNLQAWQYQPVHNVYLLSIIELGVIPWLIFGLVLVYLFKNSIKSPLKLGLIICLLIIFAFDHYFWSQEFGIALFWLIAAILLIQKVRRN